MFLRAKSRLKDGKEHRYWSIVENQRTADNRVVQRQLLYLGEINDSQHAAWCKTIDVLQGDKGQSRQMALFPADRQAPELACEVVQIRLNELELQRTSFLILPSAGRRSSTSALTCCSMI